MKGKRAIDNEDFAKLLYLNSCSTVFFISSGPVFSWAYVKNVDNLKSMKNYAWSDQIPKELQKTMEVAAVHPERVNYCVLALLYWLCEHTTLVKVLHSACPRLPKVPNMGP